MCNVIIEVKIACTHCIVYSRFHDQTSSNNTDATPPTLSTVIEMLLLLSDPAMAVMPSSPL